MPITLDDLDSPVLNDAQSSFVDGQFSNSVPLQIGEQSCKLIEDCEISVTGQAQSRRGTLLLDTEVDSAGGLVRGISYYSIPAASYPVAISNTTVRKWNGTAWVDVGVQTFTNSTLPVVFVPGNGYLYVTDGAGAIRRWNNSVWSSLSTDTPPTTVSLLSWHTNRLIASGVASAPDAVYFSGILDDTQWATLGGGYQIQPGAGDGAAVTSLVSWSNFNLAVFKHNSTWLIGADPLLDVADMPVQLVHSRIGCVAARSAVQVGADIMFLSQDGVRSLQQTIATDNQYQLGLPLSFPVQDIIDRINPAAASKAAAAFWRGRYLLSLPLDSSTTNNYILVWDSISGKWTGGWTNLPVNCFTVRTDSGTDKLFMGLSNARKAIDYLDYVSVADADDNTYTDWNSDSVSPHIISRGMIFGDLYSPKKGIAANVVINNTKGSLDMTLIFDEGASKVTKSIVAGDPSGFPLPTPIPITFPRVGLQVCTQDLMEFNEFHQLQVELQGTDAGRKEIRQITVSAFPGVTDFAGNIQAT